MFVIFGIDEAQPEITISKQERYCSHCHNSTFWHLAKHQTRVSLFFIPLVPVKTKYFFLCPICNHGEEISSTEYHSKIK